MCLNCIYFRRFMLCMLICLSATFLGSGCATDVSDSETAEESKYDTETEIYCFFSTDGSGIYKKITGVDIKVKGNNAPYAVYYAKTASNNFSYAYNEKFYVGRTSIVGDYSYYSFNFDGGYTSIDWHYWIFLKGANGKDVNQFIHSRGQQIDILY